MSEGGWLEAQNVKKTADLFGDVLISRGGTAFYLAKNLKYPVVTVNTGLFDIIESCKKAKKFSPNIVITTFKPLVGLRLVEEVLSINITELVIKGLPELEKQTAQLAEEGNYCVVGGGVSILYAEKYGVPSIFLHTSRDTIREALLRAKELADLHYEEKRLSSRLKAILDCTAEGIVAIDQNGKIEICNQAAGKILKIKSSEVIGQSARDIIPNSRMQEVLVDGQPRINEFQDAGIVRIVTSRVPVNNGRRIIGAVATFQEVSRITQIEHRIRQESTEQKYRFNFGNQAPGKEKTGNGSH